MCYLTKQLKQSLILFSKTVKTIYKISSIAGAQCKSMLTKCLSDMPNAELH